MGRPGNERQTVNLLSFQIASVDGIPIRIHFTLWLLLIWLGAASHSSGLTIVLLAVSILACIVLHELGHALVARHFGIITRDITVYPIGGVASLSGRRPKPHEEFWIALAGPAVNFLIAGLLAPIVLASSHKFPFLNAPLGSLSFIDAVFVANLWLPIFNLIPAFPMDGGRILRSVLAMRMPVPKATRIAAGVGQLFAILMAIFGMLSGNGFLILIAFLVFIGASQEITTAEGFSLVENHTAGEAMLRELKTVESGASLGEVAKILLEGSQQDFPVVVGTHTVGILTRSDIITGIATEGESAWVSSYMRRNFNQIEPNAPLARALEALSSGDRSPILVIENEELVGMLTSENIVEFMSLEHARRHSKART
ncbi:MAG: site-2 protease family protein [Armatimonadetes bacterium]|nr:site-2 protease family protein [Armatimonadota bacterium]